MEALDGNYSMAKSLYEKVRLVDPQNKIAEKMLKHLDYALQNSEKINSNFFDCYVGKYADKRRVKEVSREGNKIYLFSRGSKMRFFPLSDTEFTILGYNVTYKMVLDESGNCTEMLTNMGEYSSSAKRVQ